MFFSSKKSCFLCNRSLRKPSIRQTQDEMQVQVLHMSLHIPPKCRSWFAPATCRSIGDRRYHARSCNLSIDRRSAIPCSILQPVDRSAIGDTMLDPATCRSIGDRRYHARSCNLSIDRRSAIPCSILQPVDRSAIGDRRYHARSCNLSIDRRSAIPCSILQPVDLRHFSAICNPTSPFLPS